MAAQILPGESCPVEVQDVQVCRRDAPGLAWRIIDIVCGHEQPPADHRKLSQRKVDRLAFAAMRRRANDGTAGLPQSLIEPSRSASAARADSGWRALNCGSAAMRRPSGATPVLGPGQAKVLSQRARPRVAQPTGCVASRRVTSNQTGPSSVRSLTTDTVDSSPRRTHLAVGMQLTPNRGDPQRDSHWGH